MRVVVADPAAPVVAWDQAQAHLRLDGEDDEQAIVEGYVAAATAHLDGAEGWLGRNLSARPVDLYVDAIGEMLILPLGPVGEIDLVEYRDPQTGAWSPVATSVYEVAGDQLSLAWQQRWPSVRPQGECFHVRYTSGYDSLPAPIHAAILLMTADLYNNRQTVETGVRAAAVQVPFSTTVENLLTPYRRYV